MTLVSEDAKHNSLQMSSSRDLMLVMMMKVDDDYDGDDDGEIV